MQITLARIDDRLIHGRVTTVWSKVANAQRIIICNDDVFNDEVRRTLLRQAAPPGMKVNVVSLEKAVAVYRQPAISGRDRLLFIYQSTRCFNDGAPGRADRHVKYWWHSLATR